MANDEGSSNTRMTKQGFEPARNSSDFGIRHSPATPKLGKGESLRSRLIATDSQLAGLLNQMDTADRVAVDTEADSLHSYREKLCLLQISLPAVAGIDDAGLDRCDFIVDPLADIADPAFSGQPLQSQQRDRTSNANRRGWAIQPVQRSGCPPGAQRIDLASLRVVLEQKEIVLHGADYDLRLLRRGLNLSARRIFDTVLGARLLGIREFGLAALVERYFGVQLGKHSQKANWGRRPLPEKMLAYAINDVHYLLPLADRLEGQLRERGRIDWLGQSCQRAIEQAAVDRVRDAEELWRIRGSAHLRGRAAAVLRELWLWREKEAKTADRPPFHILPNHDLLDAATQLASGEMPDYRHFSTRRRRAFQEAAQRALELPESEWPVLPRRFGKRPNQETIRQAEELRQRRDSAARQLGLESSFITSRSALLTLASDPTRTGSLLVPWQRQLLGL
jgi:ribonuclease D